MTTLKTGEWKPLFYTKEEYHGLFDRLLKSVEQSRERTDKNYSGDLSEVPVRVFVERRLKELGSAAQDTLENFHRWRDGELERTIKRLNELPHLLNSLEAHFHKWEPVFENYGPSLNRDAEKLLSKARLAAKFYEQCYKWTRDGIKSEGAHYSQNLANSCLNDFLIVVCMTWYQSTAKKITVGSGKGAFGCFAEAAVIPLATKMCHSIPKLVATDWAKWTNLAARIRRLEIRDHKFLTPVSEIRQPE